MYESYRCPDCDLRFRSRAAVRGDDVYCPECGAFVADAYVRSAPRYRRKRGLPVWAIVLLVIVGIKLAAIAIIGAIVVISEIAESNRKWATFSPPGGNLQVEMPGTPVRSQPKGPVAGNLQMFVCERRRGHEAFLVGYVDDVDTGVTPQALLDRMATAFVTSDPGNRELSRKTIWNGPYRGCEVRLSTRECPMILHVHLVGDRAYMLVAGGPGFTPQTPDVVRFFNSFKVTNVPGFTTPATDVPPRGAK